MDKAGQIPKQVKDDIANLGSREEKSKYINSLIVTDGKGGYKLDVNAPRVQEPVDLSLQCFRPFLSCASCLKPPCRMKLEVLASRSS